MDGENNGKAYDKMDDLGGKPAIFGNTQIDRPGTFLVMVPFNVKLHHRTGCKLDVLKLL